jgi:hypothetical protein
MNEPLLRTGFWIYFLALFPSYLISILWAELGAGVHILASVGSIAQWFSIVLILFAFRQTFKELKFELSGFSWFVLLLTFALLFVKSTLELEMIHPGLSAHVNETRSVIIGYLHLTLLGFISMFILLQYQLTGIVKTNRLYRMSFGIFLTGFTANEPLLFLKGLGQVFKFRM